MVPFSFAGHELVALPQGALYWPARRALLVADLHFEKASWFAALGQMLAEKGIRVNCVAPGPIWTPLIPSTFPPEKVKEFGKNVPMKRPGQPKEVAPVFVFLASDDASYVTGALYPVTGGTPML